MQNRIIKFRAWDGQKMWDNICVHFGKQWDLLNDRPVEGYPIMQFTGLKDKNGKSIYEGDIIKTIGSEGGQIRHSIIFQDGSFCSKHLKYDNIGKLRQEWIDECEFEVIGNIYENPEL